MLIKDTTKHEKNDSKDDEIDPLLTQTGSLPNLIDKNSKPGRFEHSQSLFPSLKTNLTTPKLSQMVYKRD